MIHTLHPELRPHAQALLDMTAWATEVGPDTDQLAATVYDKPDWRDAYRWADARLNVYTATRGGNLFAVPFLDPGYCQQLIERAEALGAVVGYKPNPVEDTPYQIPEIVLRHVDAELHNELADLLQVLGIWFTLIYQNRPCTIGSIQFAKYEPHGTAHGNWHYDADSSYTAVVSLDPSRFEGGGTDVLIDPLISTHIPSLPAGYALIFNGQQIRHRGHAVTAGTRHLLVYWLH